MSNQTEAALDDFHQGMRQFALLAAASIASVPIWAEAPLTWRVKYAIPAFVMCIVGSALLHFVTAGVRIADREEEGPRIRAAPIITVIATSALFLGMTLAGWELALR